MTQDDFVKSALDDCQLTIRALDVKCGAILVLLLSPLPFFGRIFTTIENIGPTYTWIGTAIVFFGLWGAAIITMLRALAPLDNPASHIPDAATPTGAYYRSGMYTLSFIDALLNREVIKSTTHLKDAVAQLPPHGLPILAELIFEHMKVCYIRDVKMSLQRGGFLLAQGWLLLGVIIYVVARYKGGAA
jgi:hypothetical protein